MKINETINYDRFKAYPMNRRVKKIDALVESMRQYGFNPAYPIYAVTNGGHHLIIKDGHHRFEAARRLNIPIKYVVQEENGQTIQKLQETSPGKWTTRDYLESHATNGNQDYLFLLKFVDRTGINIASAMNMLSGKSANTSMGCSLHGFWDGKFRITEDGLATSTFVQECVDILKRNGCKFATNSHLINALVKVSMVRQVKKPLFRQKLHVFATLLKKQHTINDYILNLAEIYNRNNRQKVLIPLRVAEEMERRRKQKG